MSAEEQGPQPDDPQSEDEEQVEQDPPENREEERVVNIHIEPAPEEPDIPYVQWVGLLPRIDRQVERVREDIDTSKSMTQREMEYSIKRKSTAAGKDAPAAKKHTKVLKTKTHKQHPNHDMLLFQNLLHEIANRLERLERMAIEDRERRIQGNGQNGNGQHGNGQQGNRPATPPPGPSGQQGNYGNRRQEPPVRGNELPNNCIFCDGKHWASDCRQCNSLSSRRKRLQEKGKCERCLGRNDHLATMCDTRGYCFYCKREGRNNQMHTHHSCMCPFQFNFDL
ncbi:hypothetical protein Aduo_007267 [Ancylostoma duodenale]